MANSIPLIFTCTCSHVDKTKRIACRSVNCDNAFLWQQPYSFFLHQVGTNHLRSLIAQGRTNILAIQLPYLLKRILMYTMYHRAWYIYSVITTTIGKSISEKYGYPLMLDNLLETCASLHQVLGSFQKTRQQKCSTTYDLKSEIHDLIWFTICNKWEFKKQLIILQITNT